MPENGAVASVLLRMHGSWPLSAAAREYARAGVPVFPCVTYGKRPATAQGFRDATTDLKQVDLWWRKHPGANIGIPTGAASGVVVVDVDVHDPVDGRTQFDRATEAGLVAGWEVLVRTPSGGEHAYFPATPASSMTEQRSWQAARAGIDFRGEGGYIIVPPSAQSIQGTRVGYRVETVNPGPATPVDSAQLRDFLDPRPAPNVRAHGVSGAADVSRLAAWVAARCVGERNRGLFWAACRLAENDVAATDALDVLTAAAGQAGLGEREIAATIRSAYRTAHPRPQASSASRSRRGATSSRATGAWFDDDGTARTAPGVLGLG